MKGGDVRVACLAQEIFYGLHCALSLAIGLWVSGRASRVCEAELLSELSELGTCELRAVVRYKDVRDAMGGED
ncbi:hypothetical protein PoB_005250600 [Plakobranchus ocellatus]|uniref:Uncharacterized protein n=1 Tax=Plakobranchus ocellatus TaxID=259542 RepID=A0AAV4BZP6_9GAST|nr:hypothetical protein PoB_005250600 [Plakobranchus ocellatus]